jgi:hypothetical protein
MQFKLHPLFIFTSREIVILTTKQKPGIVIN